jgi:Ran GTPase-activating protein (RanGAP) involved in mRNA processing and transport
LFPQKKAHCGESHELYQKKLRRMLHVCLCSPILYKTRNKKQLSTLRLVFLSTTPIPWDTVSEHLKMSGGKATKQPTDEEEQLQLQVLHHTHREATLLFLMAVRQGATDAQIANALRQCLPHLTDPASVQDRRAGKEPEGTGTTWKGKQPAAQKKTTRTTSQAQPTQPALLAADSFAAALEAVPADDWCRTWAAGMTIMLRRTSKRVKEVVDKMRLPAVVCLSRSFWNDARNGTEKEKRQFVLRQLKAMTARCSIIKLELCSLAMIRPHAEWLAGGVLAECRALVHLDLSDNMIGSAGAESLAGVLGQCASLARLNLRNNGIGAAGAESLARVLGQCASLTHLNLSDNLIGSAGAESLAGVLGQCASLAHLNLRNNDIGAAGADSLAGVLGQCASLARLDLSCNYCNQIGDAGAEALAGVLGQCAALARLDLSESDIGAAGAESLAGVLAQCTALAHLDLSLNWIGASGTASLAGVLAQCTALAHLNLGGNQIGPAGAESLAGVLAQCAALAHLNLCGNQIGAAGAASFAGVLAQCAALAHLNLCGNQIGAAGADSFAGVLAQCRALAHLNLCGNEIGAVGGGRLGASWRGQASGLVL